MQGTILVDGNVNGIIYGKAGANTADRYLRFKIHSKKYNTALTGLKLINVNACQIFIDEIYNFKVGLNIHGDGRGACYNTFNFGSLINNTVQLYFSENADTYSWVNENTFIQGRFMYYSNTDQSNCIHIKTDKDVPNEFNNNKFLGLSFEGGSGCKIFDCEFTDCCFIQCRYEVHSDYLGKIEGKGITMVGGYISIGEVTPSVDYPYFEFPINSILLFRNFRFISGSSSLTGNFGTTFSNSSGGDRPAIKIKYGSSLVGYWTNDGRLFTLARITSGLGAGLGIHGYRSKSDINDTVNTLIGIYNENTPDIPAELFFKITDTDLKKVLLEGDVYSKDEIDNLFGTYVTEVASIVGGDA